MSRLISPALLAHLAQPVTTMCTCILLTRLDGQEFALTDLDVDIVVGGITYKTAIGYSRTAISTDAALTVGNANFLGTFDSDSLTAADLRSGKFDYASIKLFAVNWADTSMGTIILPGAVLGEMTSNPSGIFTAELRGISQFLANQIGELYTSACKASLGDRRCKVPLTDPTWTKVGAVVTSAGDNRVFTVSDLGEPRASEPTWWALGTVTWTSGGNAGTSMEVNGWIPSSSTLGLFIAMPNDIVAGDEFRITPGCDLSRGMCFSRYGNVINMRATPDIPGVGVLLQSPPGGGAATTSTTNGGAQKF